MRLIFSLIKKHSTRDNPNYFTENLIPNRVKLDDKNRGCKNGISRTENGEISSHQDAKQRMDKWL
jgi:hypothetical protein